ncbi:MAG: DUF4301 family protein [Pseudoflavonifractor sp.]|nr:DUF4301 family protein [Pseudoflavonifractor sp.]
MLTTEDKKSIEGRGLTLEAFEAQLKRFDTGFPFLHIADSASVGNGIVSLNGEEEDAAITRWEKYLADGGEVFKFVPASGAASRMFKALFEFIDGESQTAQPESAAGQFIAGIDRFAFSTELDDTCLRLYGLTARRLIDDGCHKDVISALLNEDGMNYGNLPKGMLSFHSYPDGTRTPVEEQLAEGAQTTANSHGVVNLHFTVSAEHRRMFEQKLAETIPALEKKYGVRYNVSLSEQKHSTDTVAVNPDNTPFREDGKLVFRPGGHGALIENLSDIDSAVVFIKNIDNVVPDHHRNDTIRYKKVIAGYLIQVHDKIEEYLRNINSGRYSIADIREMIAFLHKVLNVRSEVMKNLEDVDLVLFIKEKLNRPLRVCGMVRNEGEPGGGPFIAYNRDGSTSPQILESWQVDSGNREYKEMMARATHFNPVDLVCYIKDIDGNKFDLPSYVDPETGFISEKSKHGATLKALELPGLWNGAMSDWNTVFVEVSVSTFNPVKTVNDLLRPAHQ